ncbi:MAG: nucleotidyltransferase domain-containing protein [Myxococcota bacterium]
MQPDLDLARRFLALHPPVGTVAMCGITGSHQYGFPSVDSDLDLKGIHVAPTEALLGLTRPTDAHDRLEVFEGTECDLTTHEIGRALSLLLKGNGNVLERLASPYQLVASDVLTELRAWMPDLLSRRCHGHYAGYLQGMRREHARDGRVKSLLYAYRVALTGIHVLRTGEVEANLPVLARTYGVDGLDALIERKRSAERGTLDPGEEVSHLLVLDRLGAELDAARDSSPLPEHPGLAPELDGWLVELRRAHLVSAME